MAKALTQLAVKAAKPAHNRIEIPDCGCTMLYLIVQPSGVKSWALRYRFKGAPKKLTLGRADQGKARFRWHRRAKRQSKLATASSWGSILPPRRRRQAAAKQSIALRTTDTITGLSEQFVELYAKPRTRPHTFRQTCTFCGASCSRRGAAAPYMKSAAAM